jgi:hypothetical protein
MLLMYFWSLLYPARMVYFENVDYFPIVRCGMYNKMGKQWLILRRKSAFENVTLQELMDKLNECDSRDQPH